jgi:uncharacterized Ntn-hydrolase superfamily protein
MTWSIVAQESVTGRIGIAVASRFFAVGARVPFIRTGAGAVATQALLKESFGLEGLDLMAGGASADETLHLLIAGDEGRDQRQLHVMDKKGRFAAHTGARCIAWCGHWIGKDFSVAGNMLAGPEVIEATIDAYQEAKHLPLARRLIAAMRAGEAAGGDKRGKQSAALLVHDAEAFPIYDIRADDHPDPLAELSRLHSVALERFVHFRRCLPSRNSTAGMIDRDEIERFIGDSIAEKYE